MSLSQRAFQLSAKDLLEKRFHSHRYDTVLHNLDVVNSLSAQIVEAAKEEKNLYYSDWIVGRKFAVPDGTEIVISRPPWEGDEKKIVDLVLEFLALRSSAMFGYMMTVRVVKAGEELAGLPSKGFSFLAHDVENWRYDRDKIFKFNLNQHKALTKEHKSRFQVHLVHLQDQLKSA